jgi:hypothetical protein
VDWRLYAHYAVCLALRPSANTFCWQVDRYTLAFPLLFRVSLSSRLPSLRVSGTPIFAPN